MKSRFQPILVATALMFAALLPLAAQTTRPADSPVETLVKASTAPVQTGPSGILSTIAGNGYPGDLGNGGPAIDAEFGSPQGVAVDSAGNVYVADPYAEVVRKITVATGMISGVAGSGEGGYAGDHGLATAASFHLPTAVAVDASGNLYISDSQNNVIRMVTAKTGIVTTIAGTGYGAGAGSVDKCGAYTEGVLATAANLCFPRGVAVDPNGNVFIADARHHRVLELTLKTGILSTVAGTGIVGYTGDGGLAINAEMTNPQQIAIDSKGSLYIVDGGNCAIRKVSAGIITSLVGNQASPHCGLSGDGAPASKAQIGNASGVAVDAVGNVFIADGNDALIRMISAANGNIYTVAGSYIPGAAVGNIGYTGIGGPAVYAALNDPNSIAVDSNDSLYLVDTNNFVAQKIPEAGVLPTESPIITPAPGAISKATTVTITSPVKDAAIYYTTNGTLPSTSSTRYTGPFALTSSAVVTAFATVTGAANTGATVAPYLYVPSAVIAPGSETIHKATTVTLTDANAKAQLYYTTDGTNPTAAGPSDKLYTTSLTISATTTLQVAAYTTVTDAGGNVYGSWSPVTSATYTFVELAAAAPVFTPPGGTYLKAQSVTLTDATAGTTIYYTTNGAVPTASSTKYTGAIAVTASGTIQAIAIESGYVNSPIATAAYVINPDAGIISTVAGNGTAGNTRAGGPALSAELNVPFGLAFDAAGNYYFSDYSNDIVHKVTPAGIITTFAGNGVHGYGGDGGPATSAELKHPQGLAFDGAGNLYITEGGGCRIRKVTPAGIITTVAGNGTPGYNGDGIAAVNAELYYPGAVAVDSNGNLYIADYNNNRVRKVTPAGTISTVAGKGTAGETGNGGPATAAELNLPQGIAVDAAGNLYIADSGGNTIRKVTASGTISTLAGNGTAGYSGDGGAATAAKLDIPYSVHMDTLGNLYIADYGSNTVRRVTPAGAISTVAGNGAQGYSGDGAAAPSAELYGPADAAVDNYGNLYLTDSGNNRVRKVTYPAAAMPAFTPVAGTYSAAQSVKITDATPGASIYYTTNGAVPTALSKLYTGAISITATATLKAIAIASGYSASTTGTAAYTID